MSGYCVVATGGFRVVESAPTLHALAGELWERQAAVSI